MILRKTNEECFGVTFAAIFLVTLYNTGALISINSCLTNAQIILN